MYDPLRAKTKVVFYTLLAFVAGIGIASGFGWTENSIAMPVVQESPQVSAQAVQSATSLSDAFVSVSDAVTPAVVRIEAQRLVAAADLSGIPEQFRDMLPRQQQDREPQLRPVGGSGFLVSEDGYILTNEHVVGDASNLRVYFSNGRYIQAEFIGGDPLTDVAVIKVPPESVPGTLSFGSSDDVRVGEWVLAIGNPGIGGSPEQLDYTVTAGIVSAKGRSLQLLQNELRGQLGADSELPGFTIEDFIQTDAVINPGNSGGPMVDMQGRVIGINSAIASRTGFYQGYGFAIPIDLARRIMEDLIEFGQVRRPLIGVQITEVAPEDAEIYGLPQVGGALVQSVTPGGPADRAGLRMEDVIVAVGGESVDYVSQLQGEVAMYRPGDRVDVTVYRDGEPRTFTVQLEEAPINEAPPTQQPVEPDMVDRLGIGVQPMSNELAGRFGYEVAEGVIVSQVEPGSAAQRRNIIPGERILEIGDTPIGTVEDVERALAGFGAGDIVRFLLGQPDDGTRVVNVRMPT